ERKVWADVASGRVENSHRGQFKEDLSRVAPQTRSRIISERMEMRLAADAYLRAWDEVEAAFAQGQPESLTSLALVDLAIEWERSNNFSSTMLENRTIWECTQQGFGNFETQRNLQKSGSGARRATGRDLDSRIKAAGLELLAQVPTLANPRMVSEL